MMSTGSGSRSEGSVQFSLGELLKLEDERVAAEEQAAKAREVAIVRARLEADAQLERARIADEEAQQKKAREEEARREAVKCAAVEQARIEVEAHARAMERERERRHELELAAHRAVAKPPTPSIGILFGATLFGGLLMLVVLLAIHLGVSKPAGDRQLADLDGRIAAAEKRADDANHRANDLASKITTVESERNAARSEVERLKAAAASKPVKKDPPPSTTVPAPAPKPVKEPSCDPKDPMCFALPKAG